MTTFIGIDLAWQSDKNHTGIAVLSEGDQGLELIDYSIGSLKTLKGVVDYVCSHATENTAIAIDAPLIICNSDGQRPCETQIGHRFGKFHASAHTSNLRRYPDAGSVRLVRLLGENDFEHNPNPAHDHRRPGRWIFEVYPHAAQVILFGLPQIIKYKKGRIAEKRTGLRRLQGYVRTHLTAGVPSLRLDAKLNELLDYDLERLTGESLKAYEDTLDGLVCAYLSAFYWFWGGERNEMIGDLETGYIINPTQALLHSTYPEAEQ